MDEALMRWRSGVVELLCPQGWSTHTPLQRRLTPYCYVSEPRGGIRYANIDSKISHAGSIMNLGLYLIVAYE